MSLSGSCQCVEVFAVGFGQGMEVLLSRLDLGVAHTFHHASEVGAFGEQPGGVGVPHVMHPGRGSRFHWS